MGTSKIINVLPKLQMLQIEESSSAFIAASARESAIALLPPTDAKALQRLIASYQMPSDERIAEVFGLRVEQTATRQASSLAGFLRSSHSGAHTPPEPSGRNRPILRRRIAGRFY